MLSELQDKNSEMVKRANPVVPWNAPKRRRFNPKPKIALSQLPASVKPEVKFSDKELIPISATAFVELEVAPDSSFTQQGDDGDQMIGSEIYMRSLDYTASLPGTGWTNGRLTIVMRRDPSITPTALGPHLKYSHREYVVLHDEVFSAVDMTMVRVKKTLNMKQKWNLTGSIIQEGAVYVLLNLDTAVSGIETSMRLYFTDP